MKGLLMYLDAIVKAIEADLNQRKRLFSNLGADYDRGDMIVLPSSWQDFLMIPDNVGDRVWFDQWTNCPVVLFGKSR